MSKTDQLRQRPPHSVISTRLDDRYLASLVLFWRNQSESPRSLSELVRLSVETFVDFLVLNKQTEFVQKLSDAQEILENTGFKSKKINSRNIALGLIAEGSSVQHALQTPEVSPGHSATTASTPVGADSPELASAKAELEKRLAQSLEDQLAEANSRTEEFKKHILNPGGQDESDSS